MSATHTRDEEYKPCHDFGIEPTIQASGGCGYCSGSGSESVYNDRTGAYIGCEICHACGGDGQSILVDKITITQKYGSAYDTTTQSSMKCWWVWVKGVGCSMSFPCVKKQSARQLRAIRKKVNIHQKLSGPAARHYFYNVADFGDFS